MSYNKYKLWGIYIDYSDWKKSNKATINPINKKDNNCFKYVITVTLNYEQIKKDPQGKKKAEPFINKYNWDGINYPPEKDDWKKMRRIM